MARVERPLGVTVLAVLDIITGILVIIGGIAIAEIVMMFPMIADMTIFAGFAATFGAVFGGVLVIMGVIAFLVGWGFWKGKEWAWTLGVILYVICIILGLLPILRGDVSGIVGIIVGGVILYYLFKPSVRAWFKFP